MIIVKESELKEGSPFICHGFVCDSRSQARQLTYALAAVFKDYGKRIQNENPNFKKKLAIDLRTPEEIQNASDDEETEA